MSLVSSSCCVRWLRGLTLARQMIRCTTLARLPLRQSNRAQFSTAFARLLQNEPAASSPTPSATPPLPLSAFPYPPRPKRATGNVATPIPSTAESPLSTEKDPGPIPVATRRPITSYGQLPSSFGKNQIIEVPQEVRKTLEEIVRSFQAPIRYAFAYGSGVFQQSGYTAAVRFFALRSSQLQADVVQQDAPLLDFIFAVTHPSHWHAKNMQQNPHHYSLPMRILGSDAVAWMQEKGLGAGVWFNVGVEVNGKVSIASA